MARCREKAKQLGCRAVAFFGGWPRLTAIIASLTAVALALAPGGLPGGRYNAELAVLTATLVAVIWYVYATFRVAQERGHTVPKSHPNTRPDALHLRPAVENPSSRRLRLRIHVLVKIDDQYIDLPESICTGAETIRLEPGRSWQLGHQLAIHDHYPDPYIADDHDEALVLIHVKWINEFCEGGSNTHCQRIPLPDGGATSVDRPEFIEEHFGDRL